MTKPSFDYEKVDELFKNAKSIEDITGKNGFLQEMFKGTIERLFFPPINGTRESDYG